MSIIGHLSLTLRAFIFHSLSLVIIAGINLSASTFDISLDEFHSYSQQKDLLRLQTSLPKDIADFLSKDSDFKIINFDHIRKILRKKSNLKKLYHFSELKKICKKLNSDFYISGSIDSNRKYLLVQLQIYSKEKNSIFSFQVSSPRFTPGNLALRAFMIVRSFFAKKRYTSSKIPPPAKLLLISNLNDQQVNLFAIDMLRKGYRFSTNGFANFKPFLTDEVALFRHYESASSGFTKVRNLGERWQHNLVSNLRDNLKSLKSSKKEFNKIIGSYSRYRFSITKRLLSLGNSSQADFLVILYAHKNSNKSFARGFDLVTGNLVWAQDAFFDLDDNIRKISAIISREMLKSVKTKIWKPKKRRTKNKEKSPTNEKKHVAIKEDKAIVAILNFYDNTKSENFSWLSVSLADSIDDSMQNKFIYNRAGKESIQKKSQNLLQGKFSLTDDEQEKILKQIELLGADYLIYGKYTFDKIKEVIHIEAKVYNLYTKKQIGKAIASSKTDMSLFKNVDLVVDKIVKDIYKFAISQESDQVDDEVDNKPSQSKKVKPNIEKYIRKQEDPNLVSLRKKIRAKEEYRYYKIEVIK